MFNSDAFGQHKYTRSCLKTLETSFERKYNRASLILLKSFHQECALLKRDAELLSKIPPGQEPPSPLLYDPEVHRRHRQGHYKPLKSIPLPNTITFSHDPLPE
jgi:hypothetical protein